MSTEPAVTAADHPPDGACCAGREPGPGERKIHFVNSYADGYEHEVTHVLRLDGPGGYADADAWQEYIDEELHDHTGCGHFEADGSSIDAGYFADSVDGLEPEIHYESYG